MFSVLYIDKFLRDQKAIGPIKTSEIYLGNTETFNPNGLYSEEIFNIEGSLDRGKKISWIELNCNVIHPVIFDVLCKRIFRKIKDLLSGEKSFTIDENGYLVEDEYGEITGMSSLFQNIDKIRFNDNEKDGDEDILDASIITRKKIINLIYSNVKTNSFFMDRLIVIPPNYRPINKLFDGSVQIDALTELYQKIIKAGNQLKNASGILYDVLAYRMQLLIRDLYELITTRIAKKNGLIRTTLLGRRVDYSARSVIAPNPKLDIGTCGLPVRLAIAIFEPFILYGLLNSPYAKDIPMEFHRVAKEFLFKESAAILD